MQSIVRALKHAQLNSIKAETAQAATVTEDESDVRDSPASIMRKFGLARHEEVLFEFNCLRDDQKECILTITQGHLLVNVPSTSVREKYRLSKVVNVKKYKSSGIEVLFSNKIVS